MQSIKPKSILHELYVYSEWKPESEYIQKPDNILPENISVLWRWMKFIGPKKSLINSITAYRERHQKWHIALGDEGKVIAILTDCILEIRTKRSDYATIAARTTVSRDAYSQWRKLVWSPDCSFVVVAYGNGVVSFFDLTASNLFNIPTDCLRPGGLECTDNTHAVAEIIFMPLRVKNNKWNWEVLVITYDGKLRSYLVSQTEGYKLQHTFCFPGGVSSVAFCTTHSTLYAAGVPQGPLKDLSSPLSAGITAWRPLNDDPYYKLSVVSDQLEAQLAKQKFQMYIPFITSKNLTFIVKMVLSPDSSKLVCLHCNGEVSIWRLPLLKLLYRWPLALQPKHDLRNPLVTEEKKGKNDVMLYHSADVNWWSNEELILSRFSGAVSICNIEDMVNILGKKPEFFQGSPQLTPAFDGTFMALECESNILPAKKLHGDDSMELVKVENEVDDSILDLTKELFKSVLYAITDMETFQPRPKIITVVSRVYRLLGVKSTTSTELFSRKIESGNYSEALALAESFGLDSDLVYQQQWRKNPVSTDAIQNFLSKVSKKVWAVHQCVDRLPETLPAAKELLQFGLQLTNEEILKEVNKERDDPITDPESITAEDLNAYSSELLRCRHVMLFYKERLKLYQSILRCEKSSYIKDEYDRLRSNNLLHSAIAMAKEGRIEALQCLWPHINSLGMQLTVLDNLPETINPIEYAQLLPYYEPWKLYEMESAAVQPKIEYEHDWCRKEIFRSIWNSNWSEDLTPDAETSSKSMTDKQEISKWYEKRAREIEERSGLVSHALNLVKLAIEGGVVDVQGTVYFHLTTLDVLVYDLNVEEVTLSQLEKMSKLEVCALLMKKSTLTTFVADLQQFVGPYLKRLELLTRCEHACVTGLCEYLESISVNDLSYILRVLQSPIELDVRTHLELVERCLLAHTGTDQLDMACDLLDTILKETDGSISPMSLVRRAREMEQLVRASSVFTARQVPLAPRDIRDARDPHALLTRLARTLPTTTGDEKPTQQDWENLLKDLLELQSSVFGNGVTKEQCHEIYASSLLTSGDATSIKFTAEVLTCDSALKRSPHLVQYDRSIELIFNAAREYFNSSSSLTDPALELARCCLQLVKDENETVQQQLDLISALHILSTFNLDILPIQVSLCEDKMTLIEDCLKSDPNAFLAGHKLLKLATLLKIAGDDEQAREGAVLQLVGEYALKAGPAGSSVAVSSAVRVAALRRATGTGLMWETARLRCGERGARRRLLAATAALQQYERSAYSARDVLALRLELELEELQVIGTAMKSNQSFTKKYSSIDDEFADAFTTPIIENKDLVTESNVAEENVPLFSYLLDTIQNQFKPSENKSTVEESVERSIHCQEFYASLYPEHKVSDWYYRYDKFSIPDSLDTQSAVGQSVLRWFYVQNCLENGVTCELETEVVQKCAEELLYKDTPLSVACLLRSAQDYNQAKRMLDTYHSDTAINALLYATLIKCNAPELRDNVYLTKPSELARRTLKSKNASQDQMNIIRECIEKLAGFGEVEKLRHLGFTVNAIMFNADSDYRQEVIFNVARSRNKEHLKLALSLGARYGLDAIEVWLQHAASDHSLQHIALDTLPVRANTSRLLWDRTKEVLWPIMEGCDHNALITFFNILKRADEKAIFYGLSPSEHIKLLKKAKAACSELDYKLLLKQPPVEELSSHLMQIIKPENVGMLTKFLRTLPPVFKLPMSINAIYTTWLTKYFFSVPPISSSNKKWMQHYRQCASFFNKLSKEGLITFHTNTCFSDEAVQRVPAGTRNLMLMQAVDYCQQEQENELKPNKDEPSWSQIGQELTRWARFLENYHSTTIQSIVDACDTSTVHIWNDIEKSHGDVEKVLPCLTQLILVTKMKPSAMMTVLQCLHVDITPQRIFEYAFDSIVDSLEQMQTLIKRLCAYHKSGVEFSSELIERVLQRAGVCGVPPHEQVALLALSSVAQVPESGDMQKIVTFSLELFKSEWPNLDYVQQLTEETLWSEEGRREAWSALLPHTDTWHRRRALVDVLNCWPPIRDPPLRRSIHCDHLATLLSSGDPNENLVLIKLLLRRPLLVEEEIDWLMNNIQEDAVINGVWLLLLNKCGNYKETICNLIRRFDTNIKAELLEDDLIKELLDNDMLLSLLSSSLYSGIVNYVMSAEAAGSNEEGRRYSAQWAVSELVKAGCLAEAGHLQLLALGVPAALRGFTQTVLYFRDIAKK